MLKIIMMASLFILVVGCNPGENAKQGYREKQEEATTPNDYTRGTDTRTPAKTNR